MLRDIYYHLTYFLIFLTLIRFTTKSIWMWYCCTFLYVIYSSLMQLQTEILERGFFFTFRSYTRSSIFSRPWLSTQNDLWITILYSHFFWNHSTRKIVLDKLFFRALSSSSYDSVFHSTSFIFSVFIAFNSSGIFIFMSIFTFYTKTILISSLLG